MADPKTTRDAAVLLASLGVPVFPLVWRSKEPLKGSRGHLDATADAATVRRWYAGRLLNVGIRTGCPLASGYLSVFDIDGDAGRASLADLEHRHGPLPGTFTVRTSRGEHRYFSGPQIGCRTGFAPGLDWKAEGGYVVGPCSIHPSGASYACLDWSTPIVQAPGWLVHLVIPDAPPQRQERPAPVTGKGYGQAALAGELKRLGTVTVDRNISLFYCARRLGRLIADEHLDDRAAIERELVKVARQIGLEDKESVRTIRSGLTHGEGGAGHAA